MYTPTHLPDTQPLTDFREHTADVLKQLARSGKPLLITQKGKAAGVIMSPKLYEQMAEAAGLARSIAGVRMSMKQFAAGEGIPASKVLDRLEQALNPKPRSKRKRT